MLVPLYIFVNIVLSSCAVWLTGCWNKSIYHHVILGDNVCPFTNDIVWARSYLFFSWDWFDVHMFCFSIVYDEGYIRDMNSGRYLFVTLEQYFSIPFN